MNTSISIAKRSTIEHPIPSLETLIGVLNTTEYKNHGTGNLNIRENVKKEINYK